MPSARWVNQAAQQFEKPTVPKVQESARDFRAIDGSDYPGTQAKLQG